jgi:hypothetical protein
LDNVLRIVAGADTYYPVVTLNGQFWNTSGTPAYENYNSAHWDNYILTTSTSGPFTIATFPAGIPAGTPTVMWVKQTGGSPVAPTLSSPDTFSSAIDYYWDGTSLWSEMDALSWLIQVADGDEYIDGSTDPYNWVLMKNGIAMTPGGGAGELLRKKIRTIGGAAITSQTTIPGQVETNT